MKFGNYILRPIDKEDAFSLFHLIDSNRKRLEDFFAGTVSRNKSLDESKAFVADVVDRQSQRSYLPFILIDTLFSKMIGYLDIKNIDWNIPKAEIGYFIDHEYENRGITSKAVHTLIDHCFHELAFKKIFLRTHASNIASILIAEKNGFLKEGWIRSDYKMTNGAIIDVLYYGLLRTEWLYLGIEKA